MNNTPLDNARKLSQSILNSKEYDRLIKAEDRYLNDECAISLIKSLNNENTEKTLDEINKNISNNDTIQDLYKCQNDYKKLLKNIDNIIKFITNESERVNIDLQPNKHGCGGCCKNRLG